MYRFWIILTLCTPILSTCIKSEEKKARHFCSHLKAYWVWQYKDKCYTLVDEELKWSEAKERCEQRDGMLWKMNDKGLELLFVQDLFCDISMSSFQSRTKEVGEVWAGAEAKNYEFYKWIDGSDITLLNYWDGPLKLVSYFKDLFRAPSRAHKTCMLVSDLPLNLRPNHAPVYWEEEPCDDESLAICEHDTLVPISTGSPVPISTGSPVPISTRSPVPISTHSPVPIQPTRQAIYKCMRKVKGLFNPRIVNKPNNLMKTKGLEDCTRRCAKDTQCKLINFSSHNDCALYYNVDDAIAGEVESVVGWSVWFI